MQSLFFIFMFSATQLLTKRTVFFFFSVRLNADRQKKAEAIAVGEEFHSNTRRRMYDDDAWVKNNNINAKLFSPEVVPIGRRYCVFILRDV